MTDEPNGAPRIMFVHALDPLPLIDPTAAARRLKVRRHTLACYRCLGAGPAYYKFGRWIRYAAADLNQWARLPFVPDALSSPAMEEHSPTIQLVDTLTAAHFLTITRHCLSNYRTIGNGPPSHQFGRRIYYSMHELLNWARCERMPGCTDIRAVDRHSPNQLDGDRQSVTYTLLKGV